MLPKVSPTVTSASLLGKVHGGEQPVAGATIQLYAVGTAADGSPATTLLNVPVLTDANGGFTITGNYVCPSSSTLVYLLATGGNPGIGSTNAAISLMAALGSCGALTSNTFISVNELTTVASIFELAPFMSSAKAIGSGYTDSDSISLAFANVSSLVNLAAGTAPGLALNAGLTLPVSEMDTLANVIATCVNSTGKDSNCSNLFNAAKPSGGTAPANTADALMDIFQSPANNVSTLFNLAPPSGPYQPTLSQVPADWVLRLFPTVPETPKLLAEYLLNEGTGTTAHDSSGNGNDGAITGATWEGAGDLNFAQQQYISVPQALNSARTWQFAMYSAPYGSAQLPLAPGYGAPSSFGFNPSILCGTDLNHLCLISGAPGRTFEFDAYTTDMTQSAVALSPGWHIVSLLCGANVGGVVTKTHLLYDGQEVSSYIHQGDAGTCPTPTSGNYQIGGSSLLTGTWFVGKLGAAWAWNAPLTLAEASTAASTALSYLQSKGVVTQFASANNPTPLVVTGLDSRTAGYGLDQTSQAWPNHLQIDASYQVVNLAVAGTTAFDICTQFDTLYGAQIPPSSAGPVIVELWGGVNDVLFYGQTPAQVAASLECLVTKAKARGAKVILATEISSESSSGTVGDNGKDGLDAILRASAYSWGIDNLADLATDPHLGADGASSNTSCFSDGLHPTTSCEPYVTTIMQNAINELTGATQSAPHTTDSLSYQEVAGDRYLTLTGVSNQAIALPDCVGYSLPRYVTTTAGSATLSTLNGETLTGSATISLRIPVRSLLRFRGRWRPGDAAGLGPGRGIPPSWT